MTKFPFPIISITEGAAQLQIPDMAQYRVPTEAPVFYNFLMELNRDIAILAVKTYQELQNRPISILLPFAASGVRGIRFQLELTDIEQIIMNDVNPTAYALMEHNLKLNKLSGIIEVRNDDAIPFLNTFAKRGSRFEVIDVDPFGSPSRFIDSAIRALKMKSGMICLTATDMAPLCGVSPAACLRKYGGRPLRTEYCHELAVRLCLNALITTTAKYEISITPVLCYSIDHYIRIYAFLQSGAIKTDDTLKQLGYITHCFECDYRSPTNNLLTFEAKCPECSAQLDFAGPLWLGKLFDRAFCESVLDKATQLHLRTEKRLTKMLEFILEEEAGPITYHNIHRLCRKYKISAIPTKKIIQGLVDQGFVASRTHFSRLSIRTNASRAEIAQVIQNDSV